MPLLCGWKDVVVMWWMPSFRQKDDQTCPVNWGPLSIVTTAGTPNRATQVERKAVVQVAASVLFRGTASSHLVDLSIMVRR
jgi:hypothetical protein